MLLVLDNFEQLVGGRPPCWSALLAACARLKIIVTSRVRLAVAAERLLPLEGLPCPETEDDDRIEAFDAVRLFVQAAQRVETGDSCRRPRRRRSSTSAGRSRDCRWRWSWRPRGRACCPAKRSPPSCARAPSCCTPSTRRTRPATRASRSVFDQSWRLLTASSARRWPRCRCFAAASRPRPRARSAARPLPVLGALADKSLLRKDDARLSLHPLVQQLAAVRLDDGTPAQRRNRAHAVYFHRLLAQLRRRRRGRRSRRAADASTSSSRTAGGLAMGDRAGEAADALARSARRCSITATTAAATTRVCRCCGEAIDVAALRRDREVQTPAAGASGALRVPPGSLRRRRGDRAARACRAARPRPIARRTCSASRHSARAALRLGRLRRRQAPLQAGAGHRRRPATTTHNVAAMLDNLALVEKAMGHYDEALRLSLESLAQHRRLGDAAGEALCLNNLGSIYMTGESTRPRGAHLREGLAICDRHGGSTARGADAGEPVRELARLTRRPRTRPKGHARARARACARPRQPRGRRPG